jgi:2-hydroxychromene-2-carboxylate isomerase
MHRSVCTAQDPRVAIMEQIAKQLEDARWRETQLKALAFKFKHCFETRSPRSRAHAPIQVYTTSSCARARARAHMPASTRRSYPPLSVTLSRAQALGAHDHQRHTTARPSLLSPQWSAEQYTAVPSTVYTRVAAACPMPEKKAIMRVTGQPAARCARGHRRGEDGDRVRAAEGGLALVLVALHRRVLHRVATHCAALRRRCAATRRSALQHSVPQHVRTHLQHVALRRCYAAECPVLPPAAATRCNAAPARGDDAVLRCIAAPRDDAAQRRRVDADCASCCSACSHRLGQTGGAPSTPSTPITPITSSA